jgi:8-oxo-dGTP pyrophosphatase MutT (NUDIX family)
MASIIEYKTDDRHRIRVGDCGVLLCAVNGCNEHKCECCGDSDHVQFSCPKSLKKCGASMCFDRECQQHQCLGCGANPSDHIHWFCPSFSGEDIETHSVSVYVIMNLEEKWHDAAPGKYVLLQRRSNPLGGTIAAPAGRVKESFADKSHFAAWGELQEEAGVNLYGITPNFSKTNMYRKDGKTCTHDDYIFEIYGNRLPAFKGPLAAHKWEVSDLATEAPESNVGDAIDIILDGSSICKAIQATPDRTHGWFSTDDFGALLQSEKSMFQIQKKSWQSIHKGLKKDRLQVEFKSLHF